MEEKTVIYNLDQAALLGPLMAGDLLNAFYSALLLKKLSGVDLTDEVRDDVRQEVIDQWTRFLALFEQYRRTHKIPGTASGPGS